MGEANAIQIVGIDVVGPETIAKPVTIAVCRPKLVSSDFATHLGIAH